MTTPFQDEEEDVSTVKLSSKYGQTYQCTFPNTVGQEKQKGEAEKVALETGIPDLLKPMESGPCLRKVYFLLSIERHSHPSFKWTAVFSALPLMVFDVLRAFCISFFLSIWNSSSAVINLNTGREIATTLSLLDRCYLVIYCSICEIWSYMFLWLIFLLNIKF